MITFFMRRLLTSLARRAHLHLPDVPPGRPLDRSARRPARQYGAEQGPADREPHRPAASRRTGPRAVPRLAQGSRAAASTATATSGETGRRNQTVTSLSSAAPSPPPSSWSRAATILAILLGVAVGIVSALRQYTGFDYSITFMSFLLYSLPVFWVAVLAKIFLAIDFNDFLARSTHLVPGDRAARPCWSAVTVSLGRGRLRSPRGCATSRSRRSWSCCCCVHQRHGLVHRRRASGSRDMLRRRELPWAGPSPVTTLSTGLRNRQALYAALTVAALGVVLYFPMLHVWDCGRMRASWLALVIGLLSSRSSWVSASASPGAGRTGPRSARTAALTALPVSACCSSTG